MKRAQEAFDKATKAVEQGDNTLKEANNTYNTLAGFQADVQESSEKAEMALRTVPSIEEEIENAEILIAQAADVSCIQYIISNKIMY